MKGTITALLVILAAFTCAASGEITLEVVPIDNSSIPELGGWVTQDLVVTTDTDWLSAQMVVTPDTPGQIYQDSLGDVSPQSPNPAFFPIQPSLEFDTYVSSGVLGEPVSWLVAMELGDNVLIFDENKLSMLWFTEATDDIGTLALARITLGSNATGTWKFIATAAPQGGPRVEVLEGIIENGVMFIPEPATLSLLSLGGVTLLRRKSKSRSHRD